METTQASVGPNAIPIGGFEPLTTETYPTFEVKISIERDTDVLATDFLAKVMGAVLDAHQQDDPVIFLREDWSSHAGSRGGADGDDQQPKSARRRPADSKAAAEDRPGLHLVAISPLARSHPRMDGAKV